MERENWLTEYRSLLGSELTGNFSGQWEALPCADQMRSEGY